MNDRTRRPVTPAYVFFYLLFSTDTWRLFFGGVLAALATPHVAPPTLTLAGKVVLVIMLVAIGWAITGRPARWMTTFLKKAIVKAR